MVQIAKRMTPANKITVNTAAAGAVPVPDSRVVTPTITRRPKIPIPTTSRIVSTIQMMMAVVFRVAAPKTRRIEIRTPYTPRLIGPAYSPFSSDTKQKGMLRMAKTVKRIKKKHY